MTLLSPTAPTCTQALQAPKRGPCCPTFVSFLLKVCHSLLPVQAVQALYLSTLPVGVGYVTSGKSFSLTSGDVLASTFNAAIASFGPGSGGGSPAPAPSGGAAAGAVGGRRHAQAAVAAAAPAPAPAVRRP